MPLGCVTNPNPYNMNQRKTIHDDLMAAKVWPHKTPRSVADAGMKCCDECGTLNPLEAQLCTECSTTIVMFVG